MFEKLFEPSQIGEMTVKNRIVMPAMATNMANMSFDVSERQVYYYAERARGGVGLIITECVYVTSKRALPIRLVFSSPRYIAGMHDLTRAVHKCGAKIAIQLSPGHGPSINYPETEVVAASPIRSSTEELARALKTEEVEELVRNFGEAAERAKNAGFDAVEIHGHNRYLLATFMSPVMNKRVDKYGGNLEGRLRFPLEIIKCIKSKVDDDLPIIFRYSFKDFVGGERDIEEAKNIAKRLEDAGVHAIHGDVGRSIPSMYFPQGLRVHLSEEIKKVVKIPVITVGNIKDPEFADKILREGKADFVSIGRGLIADPDWPNKAKEGRIDDILRCISCNEGCIGNFDSYKRISCALNPVVGKEREYRIRPAEKIKKVLVAGGGPAGMEAARVAALRGHKVTLYEKTDKLGGNLKVASKPEFKNPLRSLIKYLSNQITKLGVEIKIGKELTLDEIKRIKPDAVIIATGATPIIPEVLGIRRDNVITAIDVLSCHTLEETGKKVVMVGGGMVGCETALYLARRGRKVTIVEMLGDLALDIVKTNRMDLLQMLTEEDVKVFKNVKLKKITDEGTIIADRKGKRIIEADTVVLAVGLKPDRTLVKALEGKVQRLYTIGDCVTPRKLMDAIHEGSSVGRII